MLISLFVLTLESCYVPQVFEKPALLDTPPFFLSEDTIPSTSQIVHVDLNEPGILTLDLDAVFDWNLDDSLQARWVTSSAHSQIEYGFMSLLQAPQQLYDDATEYMIPEPLVISYCRGVLSGVDSIVIVRLEIVDEIPLTQQNELELSQYILGPKWILSVKGNCP